MNKFIVLLVFLMVAFAACKKTEEVIVPDNTAPPDTTVSDIVVQNYVNKAYISVLGRKPTDAEKEEGITILEENNLAMVDREEFIDLVLNGEEYNEQLIKVASNDILNSFDTAAVSQQIAIFQILLQDPQYASVVDILQYEIDRLVELNASLHDLNNGTLTVSGMHKRLVNNNFYDQLNMGTENFVRATFEHFLFRYPTLAELESAKVMVDGFNSVVFLEEGDSKDDFMDIFFASKSYYEGQVRYLFLKYLFREPNSEELSAYANQYKYSGNYKLLQKTILTFDEYVGL